MDHDATLTEPIPPTPPSARHPIFFGKDGLRAGWGLLIFITLMGALIICVNVVGHKLHPPAPKTTRTASDIPASPHLLIGEALFFLATFLVTWIMSKIEQRPNSVYGLGGGRK